MRKISELFAVNYGLNLELNSLVLCGENDKNAVNFVSRTSKNNGVSAIVEKIAGIEPLPPGTITVASGGSVLETFLQPKPYYSGRDLYYLTPKVELTEKQKLYYCLCIRMNKYKYNYGRQANKTLRDILIPDISEIPKFIEEIEIPNYKDIVDSFHKEENKIDITNWKTFRYSELFTIERGRGPRKQELEEGIVPFITSTDASNGLTAYANYVPCHKGNTISVNRNGSVGEAFYQETPFCSTEDVHIFNPKFIMNKYIAMFFISLIRKEKYRYSYGRKWGINRMENSIIKLPVRDDGTPDFLFIENYIKTLPYSKNI